MMSSQGCERANVLIRNDALMRIAPDESTERKPMRAASRVASGPAANCASAVGISSSPTWVTEKPKP